MTARTADPARTHALLVGVEKYDAGAKWNTLSILRDVLELHEWLRSNGVPEKQIVTLFSPRDESAAALAESKVATNPATSEKVLEALDALQAKKGDLLLVYWGGHGALDLEEKQRRLFLANATDKNKRNINFDALKASLASTYFKGFPRQILIVDACATYGKAAFTFPSDPIPCGKPLSHEQFVFFAARTGQEAMDLTKEKRGLLSRELLKQIGKLNVPTWPPDMLAVARSVQDEFAAMRQSGRYGDLAQTPVFYLTQDWDGNVIKLGRREPAAGAAPQGEARKLTAKQVIALTDALTNVSRMQTSAGRDLVLAQLRSEIAAGVPRGDDTTSDIMNVLRTAASYPGGLEELLWFVYLFEGESVGWGGVAKAAAVWLPDLRLPSAEAPSAVEGSTAKLDLVAALEQCPTLAQRTGRDLCISLLDDPIPSMIARRDDRKADLLSIVSTCTSYEGGIESLVEAVEAREKNSVHMLRVRALAQSLLKSL
jgi:hypothetical protein